MQKIGAVMMEQMAVNAPKSSNRMNVKGNSFESVMSTAGSSSQTASKDTKPTQVTKNESSSDGTTPWEGQQKVQEVSDGTVSQDTPVENAEISQDNILTDETISKVESMISETVKNVLGIDEAALEDAMAALSLTLIDLLNPENLQQLVMYVNDGADVTDMLTSDVMMSQFNEIMAGLNELDWQDLAGMSKDEFIDAARQMMESFQSGSVSDELMPELSADTSVDENYAQKDVSSQQFVVKQDNTENDMKVVTVVKQDTPDVKASYENTANAGTSDNTSDNGFSGAQAETTVFKADTEVEPNAINGQFVQEFTQTVTEVKQTPQPNVPQMQQMIDIVNQVVERIRLTLGNDNTTMEMQLNPESLGKVYLSVAAKDGVMTASFMVQSEEAKAALESQIITLRENLEQKELKVEAVEVTVADFDFTQSGQADTENQKEFSKGNGKQFMYDSEEGEDSEQAAKIEAEAVRRQVMLDNGSSVDLTA